MIYKDICLFLLKRSLRESNNIQVSFANDILILLWFILHLLTRESLPPTRDTAPVEMPRRSTAAPTKSCSLAYDPAIILPSAHISTEWIQISTLCAPPARTLTTRSSTGSWIALAPPQSREQCLGPTKAAYRASPVTYSSLWPWLSRPFLVLLRGWSNRPVLGTRQHSELLWSFRALYSWW